MTLRVSKHSNQPCSVIFVNFYNFLNNDGCVHTDDTTKLSPTSCEFVYTPPTRQNSFVASAVCIGH